MLHIIQYINTEKSSNYIISIAREKCVQTPGNASQKNGRASGSTSIAIIRTSHKKKYIQYFPVDFLASM